MKLSNSPLHLLVDKIRLIPRNMQKYREQIEDLKIKLDSKIKNDRRTGLKVTKYVIAGSWKKYTILRPTGNNPIYIDLRLLSEP